MSRIWARDLLDAPLPREWYDLVFARWVFTSLLIAPMVLDVIGRKPGRARNARRRADGA